MRKFVAAGVRGLVVLALFVLPACGQASEEPKTESVREAKAKYEKAVKEAEAAIAAAKAAYLEQLDTAVKVALKAEDLEEANRIDTLRKALRAAPAAGAVPQGAGVPVAAAGKKPGWIVGDLKDAAGNPLKDISNVTVACFGTTIQGGQKASFTLDVDENGHFEQELPDGLYAVTVYIIKDFEGVRYRQQLHPDDNKHEQTKLPSKPGLVKNFTWKLTGLRPGYDPKASFSYYGQLVRLYDARYLGEDNEKLLGEFGGDAKAVVTLTPTGTLIDGSKAKPLTIEAKLSEIGTTLGHQAMDQPIATYRIEAKVVTKGGKEQKLRVKLEYSHDPADSVEAKFTQASEYDSIRPIEVYLSK